MIAWSAIIFLIGLVTVIKGQTDCLPGQLPFMPNQVPVACSAVNPCPPNVECSTVPTNAAGFQMLCCLNLPASCPNNMIPYLTQTGTALPCVIGGAACPGTSTCQSMPTNPPTIQTLCCNPACQATEVEVSDRCYPLLNPNGFFCYFAEQCTGLSVCTNYVCRCPATLPTVVNSVCTGSATATTTQAPGLCTGNNVLIGGNCIPKTNDGVCLSINCLSTGNAGCAAYAPYTRCGYNAGGIAGGIGQASYFCCP